MREIKFKIFDIEVVDCSSTWSHLEPPAESLDLLIRMFLKLIESDIILNICRIDLSFYYHDSTLQLESYSSPAVIANYFLDLRDLDLEGYILAQTEDSKKEKLFGLYIQDLALAERENINHQKSLEEKYPGKYLNHLIPQGMKGIKEVIDLINIKFNEEMKPNSFNLSVKIVWRRWDDYYNANSEPEDRKWMIFDLLEDDEGGVEDIEAIDRIKPEHYGNALDGLSHVGIGDNLTMTLGKDFTYLSSKHYNEIIELINKSFNQNFRIGYEYG